MWNKDIKQSEQKIREEISSKVWFRIIAQADDAYDKV